MWLQLVHVGMLSRVSAVSFATICCSFSFMNKLKVEYLVQLFISSLFSRRFAWKIFYSYSNDDTWNEGNNKWLNVQNVELRFLKLENSGKWLENQTNQVKGSS